MFGLSSTRLIILAVIALFILISTTTIATPIPQIPPTPDPVLQAKLNSITAGFRGDVGVFVRHIGSNTGAGVNQYQTFPTASIVKIPILLGIHAQIQRGELTLEDMVTYYESQAYGGSGIMQFFKDRTQVDLKTYVFLMIAFSDNVASITNQRLAGGGVEINKVMGSYGFNKTFVNSSTPGREEDWRKWGWGQTTPFEICNLVTAIRQERLLSRALSRSMYTFLGNHYYNERALGQIAPYTKSGSKSGSLDDSRSEVVFVNNSEKTSKSHGNPKGEYVFAVFTNNNQDQSWGPHNEAEELTRNVSKMLWEYYGGQEL